MDDFERMERAGWSDPAVAESYAQGFARASDMAVPALVAGCGAGPGDGALDICCGQGIVAAGLAAAGAEVTGVDFSPAMLDMARARVPRARFVAGDAMDLGFDDESFDAATMGFGILHVRDAGRALAEAARVLRPGARVAWSCWHGPEETSALAAFFQAGMAHGDPEVRLPPAPPPWHYAQPDNAVPVMEAAGFGDLRFETVACRWTCDAADEPCDLFANGSVRAAALFNAQPEANRRAIRKAVADWVEAECGRDADGRWRVPVPAVVVSGRKG